MTAETRYPAAPVSHRERHHRRSARRQDVAILATASLLGLWLGATAPDVSPAAPPAAPPTPPTTAPTLTTAPTPIVDNPAPVNQGGPGGPGGPGGRGGRGR